MSILIVGAGAAGGYIGAQLAAADRDVTFLVHPRALDRLTADGLRIRLGADVVTTSVRAATRLFASMSPDATINVVTPGIDVQIGQLDGGESEALGRTVTALEVPGITVTARRDVVSAMWEKFAFITSTAVLTCLVGDEVGPIARADGGIALARRVLAEVAAVAALVVIDVHNRRVASR